MKAKNPEQRPIGACDRVDSTCGDVVPPHPDHQIFQRNPQIAHPARNIHAHYNKLLTAAGYILRDLRRGELESEPRLSKL